MRMLLGTSISQNNMTIFDNPEFGLIRVVLERGDPWFVAKDICDVLNLGNVTEALSGLDTDEKITLRITEGNPRAGIPHTFNAISESGLYTLIVRSRSERAAPIRRWITHEVLPAIRKTGGYLVPNFSSPAEAARAWADQFERAELALRTKAEIGSRREATSMATASTAVRKASALEDALGVGRNYRQVKAIDWLPEEFHLSAGAYSQIGKKLSELSDRMDHPPRIVPDERYPAGVKSYHVSVVDAFRAQLRIDLNMLGKYRIRPEALCNPCP